MDRLKLRNDILNQIQIVCNEEGLNNYEITDVQTNQKGEGYLGEIFIITLQDKIGKQLNLVIKSAFQDEKVRRMVPIRMSFENEIYFYSKIYPAFEEFGKSKGLNGSLFNMIPKCYKCSTNDESELLILENLKVSGFEIFDKRSILNEEHVELIFKTYGQFHGFSLAYKDQNPEEYRKLVSGLQDVYSEFLNNDIFEVSLVGIGKIIEKYFIPGQDDKIQEKYQKYTTSQVIEIFKTALKSDCENSAIIHGDCWSNNMMFKYKDSGDERKLIDINLIDFQLTKSGNPVCDLSYFFYSGATKDLYDKLDDFLNIYFKSLSKTIKDLGSNPDKLYSLRKLKEDWKKYCQFGMLMSLMILKMKATDQEDIIDLTDDIDFETNKDAFVNNKFKEDVFSARALGLIKHLDEIGTL